MNKVFALLGLGVAIFATTVQSTFATTYVLSGADLTGMSTAAVDTATSLMSSLSNLLPVVVPIVVATVLFGLVIGFVHRRW